MKTTATLVTLFTLFSLKTFATDYTRWGLPKDAKAHLGKGWISGNIAYSPDGTQLAVASSIGIWLYDTTPHQVENSRNKEVALLTGHRDDVKSVAYSPEGGTIASGSADTTVRLWDAVTGQQKATLTGHTDPVFSVAFSPDGGTIASGSDDTTLRLWDAITGQQKAILTGHTGGVSSVAYSPGGGTLASGSWDNTVRLWDACQCGSRWHNSPVGTHTTRYCEPPVSVSPSPVRCLT